MNAPSDPQLLCSCAERRSEAAFAELVRGYIDLVHSAAIRMVNDLLFGGREALELVLFGRVWNHRRD